MKLRNKQTGDIAEFEAVILVVPIPEDLDPDLEYPALDYGSIKELLDKWEEVDE